MVMFFTNCSTSVQVTAFTVQLPAATSEASAESCISVWCGINQLSEKQMQWAMQGEQNEKVYAQTA
jgi:hypothetical protein